MVHPSRIRTVLLTLMVLLALVASARAQANGKLQLHFLDVGEGDATLLISPNGETVLFDNGVFRQCDKPLAYLHELGVTRIDYQLVSHYHSDHIGCTAELYARLPLTRAVYDRGPSYHGDVYSSYVLAIGSKRQTATDQTTIVLEQDSPAPVTIRIVALNGNDLQTEIEDNLSLVAVVSFGQFKAVLGGDLTGFAETEYQDIETSVAPKVGQVDVYKVHDHGSRYSSNPAWLEAVRPRIGVVSTGGGNRHGHPTEECIERLHRAGVKTYWTSAGNGVEPEVGMDVVGGNIIVEVAPNATIYTVRTTAGRTTDEYSIWAAGMAETMTGLSHVRVPTTQAGVSYSWSERASEYHFSSCSFVENIIPEDLETSTMPHCCKVLHSGCPK
jgi:beta-lactamase superfamily II metal-dependent hydrolase